MSQLFTPITLRDVTVRNRVWVAADVPVLRARRRAERLAPGPPGSPRAAAPGWSSPRRPRWCRRAGSARGHRALERRAAATAWAADRRVRARPGRGRRHPARARRPQGVDVLRPGRARRRSPRRRRLAAGRAPADRVPAAARGPEPLDRGGDRRRRRGVRRRRRARRRGRLRRGRGPRRARLPAPRVPLAAVEPPRPTRTAAPSTTGCGSCSRSCERSARRVAPAVPLVVRLSATDWVEGGWDADETVRLAAPAARARASTWSTPRPAATCSPTSRSARATRCPSPARPQRGRRADRRGRADHRTRAGRGDPRRGRSRRRAARRELLRDPHWPLRAAYELGEIHRLWPVQYRRAER